MKTGDIGKHPTAPDVPNLIVIGPEATAEEALKIMASHQVHHLLVLNGAELTGIVSDRDILSHAVQEVGLKNIAELTVGQTMRRDLPVILDTTEVREALSLMRENRLDALPIIHEDRIKGIVTETDLIHALEQLLLKTSFVEKAVEQRDAILSNPLSQKVISLLSGIGF